MHVKMHAETSFDMSSDVIYMLMAIQNVSTSVKASGPDRLSLKACLQAMFKQMPNQWGVHQEQS